MSVPALIEEAMALLHTDAAGLARRLDVGDSAISKWRSGKASPDFESCLRLARETGLDPERVLAEAGHDTTLLPPNDLKLSPYQRDVLERSRRTQELLDSIDGLPDEVVKVYIPKILDRAKDDIEETIKMLLQLRAVSERTRNNRVRPTRNNRPRRTDNSAKSDDDTEKRSCYVDVNVLHKTPSFEPSIEFVTMPAIVKSR